MAEVTDLTSVPLYQIIGAPLLAIVQAESQAAQATANFIEQVGFEPPSEDASGALKYGRLKVVTFRYSKMGADGTPTNFEVEIPVLSIVSIPTLEVREARLDFAVEINGVVELEQRTVINPPETGSGKDSSLEPNIVGFKAGLGKQDSKTAMQIHISVGQADTPVGLLSLFRVMDQGITSRSVPVDTTTTTTPSPTTTTTTTPTTTPS